LATERARQKSRLRPVGERPYMEGRRFGQPPLANFSASRLRGALNWGYSALSYSRAGTRRTLWRRPRVLLPGVLVSSSHYHRL